LQERQLDESVDEPTWRMMIGPLVDLVLRVLRGDENSAVAFAAGGDERFRDVFDAVRERISGFRPLDGSETHAIVFIRRFARSLAVGLPADVSNWIQASVLFSHFWNWASFLESIPLAAIESRVDDLVMVTADTAGCLCGPGIGPTFLESVTEVPAELDWSATLGLIRSASEWLLHRNCSVRAVLLDRLLPEFRVRWLSGLPSPLVQAVALGYIRDPDSLEAFLQTLDVLPDGPPRRLLKFLVVRRAMELWTEIERAICDAPRRFGTLSEEDRVLVDRMMSDWMSAEVPRRCASVVGMLEATQDGLEVAGLVLRHDAPFRGALSEEMKCLRALREELLRLFVRRYTDQQILSCVTDPTVASLAAGAQLALRQPSTSRFHQIISGYQEWLKNPKQRWAKSFGSLQLEMIEAIAATLARCSEPTARAADLVASVRPLSQGWKFEYGIWLADLPAFTHATVVAAVTAASLVEQNGRSVESNSLMEFALSEIQSLIEGAPTEIPPEQIAWPVVYVLCCARRVLVDGEARVERALRFVERPETILLVAKNVRENGGLGAAIKTTIRETVEEQLEFRRHDRFYRADRIAEMRRELREVLA
jgi:hypothetical protein